MCEKKHERDSSENFSKGMPLHPNLTVFHFHSLQRVSVTKGQLSCLSCTFFLLIITVFSIKTGINTQINLQLSSFVVIMHIITI